MPTEAEIDTQVPAAAFEFLRAQTQLHGEVLTFALLSTGFEFDGHRVPLGGQATFGVRYSMHFFWQDGSAEWGRNTNECYKVRQLLAENRWVIARTADYQQRICYR
jgi:hypothetical protein